MTTNETSGYGPGTSDAVAIVGLACTLPGARGVGEFWRNLRAGRDTISRFTRAELLAAGIDPELVRRPDYVAARGVLPRGDRFDWSYFGYSPAEAAHIDPQQRILLQTAVAVLEDAGIDAARFPGWIGVFAGCDVQPPQPTEMSIGTALGYEKDFLATRIAYKIGLRGPAMTVQTACSTSLVAVHTALQSLLSYDCDVALAGGVSLWLPQTTGYLFEPGGILSADGYCRPFDIAASGTVPSSGAGLVALKRLADALRDHDRIVAVIRGSVINNDGPDKIGYTSPSITGQSEAIRFALARADTDPADIGYVEAHGTGTRIGDPIEVTALTLAWRNHTDRTGYCGLGSVKSNIGHTGAAAGVASLIKTALMIGNGNLVPTLHVTKPNPELALADSPFHLVDTDRPWISEGARLAAVSSFGLGGTNAHLILEEPPSRLLSRPRRRLYPLQISAATSTALDQLRRELAEHLDDTRPSAEPHPAMVDDTPVSLEQVAWTLATGRRDHSHRLTVVADTLASAAAALRATAPTTQAIDTPRVAFVFPGQGLLRRPVGTAAYKHLSEFRSAMDEAARIVRDLSGQDVLSLLDTPSDPAAPLDTELQQAGVFALGYAFSRQLSALGIEPVALLGHSLGEYAAAAAAGVWDLDDALGLVLARARAMRDSPPGRMLAILPPEEQRHALPDWDALPPDVSIAVYAPNHLVLSGSPEQIQRIDTSLRAQGWLTRDLGLTYASHCASMEMAATALHEAAGAARSRAPAHPVVSNVTGTWAKSHKITEAAYWAEQLVCPVRLTESIATLLPAADIVLELGPGESMSRLLRGHPDWRADQVAIPLLPNTGDAIKDEAGLLEGLAALWRHGIPFDLGSLHDENQPTRCALPPYPFEPLECRPLPSATAKQAEPSISVLPTPRTAVAREIAQDAWEAILGTPPGDDAAGFFAGGGDSLMALQLIAGIRKRSGHLVPVAEFVRHATFGDLVGLLTNVINGGSHDGLMVFNQGGKATPLFLTGPALGTCLCYRHLATHLGDDRPCYGLETPGLYDGTDPLLRFEDLATHHLRQIRAVQEHGPYLLAGWSLGGVVAHEIARQLEADGDQVALVIGIDGHVRPRTLKARFQQPGMLLRTALHLRNVVPPQASENGLAPNLRFRAVILANLRALRSYRPRPIHARAVIYAANRDITSRDRLARTLTPMYSAGVEVRGAPGTHWTILESPQVEAFAADLRDVLARLTEPA